MLHDHICACTCIKLLLNSTCFQFSAFCPSLPCFSVFCIYSVDGPIQVFLLPKKNVSERRDVMVSTPLCVRNILAGFFLA